MLALIFTDENGSSIEGDPIREGAFVQVKVNGKNVDCHRAEAGWTAGAYSLAAYAAEDPVPEGKIIASTERILIDGVPTVVNTLADAPVEVPEEISDRQFFQQLAVMGLITEDEALAAVSTGTMPAAIVAFVAQLPTAQQFPAKMALQGATTFRRDNALVATFAALQGLTDAQVDKLWIDAYQL